MKKVDTDRLIDRWLEPLTRWHFDIPHSWTKNIIIQFIRFIYDNGYEIVRRKKCLK